MLIEEVGKFDGNTNDRFKDFKKGAKIILGSLLNIKNNT